MPAALQANTINPRGAKQAEGDAETHAAPAAATTAAAAILAQPLLLALGTNRAFALC